MYDKKLPLTTNDNQYDDYVEILANGYKGTKGEKIDNVTYVFPDEATAKLNTHLKAAHIFVAHPKKGDTTLVYV